MSRSRTPTRRRSKDDYEKAQSALDDLASTAPDEIKADVETLSSALSTLMDVFASWTTT